MQIPLTVIYKIITELWKSKYYSLRWKLSLGLICKKVFNYISKNLTSDLTLNFYISKLIKHISQEHEFCILKEIGGYCTMAPNRDLITEEKYQEKLKVFIRNLHTFAIDSHNYLTQYPDLFLSNLNGERLKTLRIISIPNDRMVEIFLATATRLQLCLDELSISCSDTKTSVSNMCKFFSQQVQLKKLEIELLSPESPLMPLFLEITKSLTKLTHLNLGYQISFNMWKSFNAILLHSPTILPLSIQTLITFPKYKNDYTFNSHNIQSAAMTEFIIRNENLKTIMCSYEGLTEALATKKHLHKFRTAEIIPTNIQSIYSLVFMGYYGNLRETFNSLIVNNYSLKITKLNLDQADISDMPGSPLYTFLQHCPTLKVFQTNMEGNSLFMSLFFVFKNNSVKTIKLLILKEGTISVLFDNRLVPNSNLDRIIIKKKDESTFYRGPVYTHKAHNDPPPPKFPDIYQSASNLSKGIFILKPIHKN
ncbi:hypothetical protein DLAC_01169 [Tieghemostelium lacteum]|uniref:F-box domain-containing protein n=1 Tax=Tieghemostelium lacteum TaxID=361077 RepID=A0A152A805_TIELA|nr:hypothetical protein DLAC_01169 [Tieghemostelium lacteum]|eukprot:KYR02338.1 hypothetical protein DLAC_01169 [Tieghemostelium lacteum]